MEDLAHGEGYGGDEERDQLEKILTLSREKLVEAEGDIERLRLGMGKKSVSATGGGEDGGNSDSLDEKALLEALPAKEREKALKRLRNKEAARRSRQKKQARMRELSETVDALQRENVMLMSCIEHFSSKALEAKKWTEQKESGGKASPSQREAEEGIPTLDNLGDLNRGGAPLTGRSSLTNAALDEQLAMLSSRDISPRDEDDDLGDNNNQNPTNQGTKKDDK
ncbi:hypothetical protein M9434_001568 [Picochlorum sp. BPE23]|nr:hypothetical protein M9434_001568 [Picochlorum sp. BPE23]